ncbi:MAG: GTP cyclohydrolase I [Acidobacteriia bacterium]|nr:GTP cyclohydrolase I [Terriglobia bacterium]
MKTRDLLEFVGNEQVAAKLCASQERISRAFAELFSGYNLRAEDVLNEVVHVDQYDGTITVADINFYSYCEHHFAPFFGTASVTYAPGEIITGLGKIVRLVRDVHARRLQIQELMTKDIAEDLVRVLHARGAYVETRAKHLCICSRGPSDDTTQTIVRYGCGSLASSAFSPVSSKIGQ